jgi:hypothetical protein
MKAKAEKAKALKIIIHLLGKDNVQKLLGEAASPSPKKGPKSPMGGGQRVSPMATANSPMIGKKGSFGGDEDLLDRIIHALGVVNI